MWGDHQIISISRWCRKKSQRGSCSIESECNSSVVTYILYDEMMSWLDSFSINFLLVIYMDVYCQMISRFRIVMIQNSEWCAVVEYDDVKMIV